MAPNKGSKYHKLVKVDALSKIHLFHRGRHNQKLPKIIPDVLYLTLQNDSLLFFTQKIGCVLYLVVLYKKTKTMCTEDI